MMMTPPPLEYDEEDPLEDSDGFDPAVEIEVELGTILYVGL